MKDTGKLFSTGGDDSWDVTYRITTSESGALSGTVTFAPGTQLGHRNRAVPVYLRRADGRWAELFLPDEPPHDDVPFTIGNGSHLLSVPPTWAQSTDR